MSKKYFATFAFYELYQVVETANFPAHDYLLCTRSKLLAVYRQVIGYFKFYILFRSCPSTV